MTDLDALLETIDELSEDELEKVYRHISSRRQKRYWLIPAQDLSPIQDILQDVNKETSDMSEDEINSIIDESLEEVRNESRRKNRSSD
jgi:hypothetical protein